jgi:hypothetical protein
MSVDWKALATELADVQRHLDTGFSMTMATRRAELVEQIRALTAPAEREPMPWPGNLEWTVELHGGVAAITLGHSTRHGTGPVHTCAAALDAWDGDEAARGTGLSAEEREAMRRRKALRHRGVHRSDLICAGSTPTRTGRSTTHPTDPLRRLSSRPDTPAMMLRDDLPARRPARLRRGAEEAKRIAGEIEHDFNGSWAKYRNEGHATHSRECGHKADGAKACFAHITCAADRIEKGTT